MRGRSLERLPVATKASQDDKLVMIDVISGSAGHLASVTRGMYTTSPVAITPALALRLGLAGQRHVVGPQFMGHGHYVIRGC